MSDNPVKTRSAKPSLKKPTPEMAQAIKSAFSLAPVYANSTQISPGIGTVRLAFGEATPDGSHYHQAVVMSAAVAERLAKQLAKAAEDAKKREEDRKLADHAISEEKVQVQINDPN